MRRIYLLFFLITGVCSLASHEHPFIFQQNKNQWPQKVSFAADIGTGQVFIERTGLTWVLYNSADLKKQHDNRFQPSKEGASTSDDILHGHVYKVEFMNAKLTEQVASGQQNEYYNYFLGNDPSRWASRVKAFEQIYYTNIYKNIDARFYGSKGNFKYDLIVKPGGDISKVKLDYQFTKGLQLVNNKLVIHTSVGEVIENIPEAYQVIKGKKIKIECSFVLKNNEVSFNLVDYDPKFDVVIDPVVVVASYSGTQSVSYGSGVAPDSKGNMYLYGLNVTRAYPTTPGAIQTSFAGGWLDATISKFNFLGTSKRFSTFIGGNNTDLIINCVIQDDEIAVFGTTLSDSFPIIKDGFQSVLGGNSDYYILKLDTSGTFLKASTYLGGMKAEGASSYGSSSAYLQFQNSFGEMIMDGEKNCYIIGCTYSHNYPSTPGAYREYSDSNGSSDIVIAKMRKDLSSLVWSTYYGGKQVNYPVGIRLSSKTGKLFCVGGTTSRNFPTTPGVIHTSSVTTEDMVAFTLDTLAGFPIASTYVGAKYCEALRMDIDRDDNLYMIGYAKAPAVPIVATAGAYNVSTGRCAFMKMDPALTTINVVAKFGYTNGSQEFNRIEIDAFNVDSCGYIYFGGFGLPNLPTTGDAIKSNAYVHGSLYFGVFSPGFSSLKYGSYFGASVSAYPNGVSDHDDGGLNYFDDRGYFYHAVCVDEYWPVTTGAYSNFNVVDSTGPGGYHNSDAFVKIDLQTFINANSSLGGEIKSCVPPMTQTFVATANLGTVEIIPGDGSPSVYTSSLVHTYNAHGTYTAFVIAGTDPSTCNQIDSVKVIIKYGPKPTHDLEENSENCNGSVLVLDAGNPGSRYMWNTGDTTQTINPSASGKHWVIIDNGYCLIKDSTEVLVEEGHDYSTPNAFTPNGDNVNESFCLQGWDFCNTEFKVVIFSRWGEKVFESEDPNFCWDGKFRGQLLSSDVYIYHITAKFKGDRVESRKGNVTLIR